MFCRADNLVIFVAFARNQNHIVFARTFNGSLNCLLTIMDNLHCLRASKTGYYIRHNFFIIFRTRIVIGSNNAIRKLFCNFCHQRALTRIAISSATEYAPQFTIAMHTCSLQGFLQGIRCVGVVNDSCRFIRRIEHFHPPAYATEL